MSVIVHQPNPSMYSEDYATCSVCNIRQPKRDMRQDSKAPKLKPGRAGQLVLRGADFTRTPDIPAEEESAEVTKARSAAQWVCTNYDRCCVNRIAQAVAKMAAEPVRHHVNKTAQELYEEVWCEGYERGFQAGMLHARKRTRRKKK